jgi:acyl-coenzyme A thioesterase PaaI-like protein
MKRVSAKQCMISPDHSLGKPDMSRTLKTSLATPPSSSLSNARQCFVCGPDNPVGLHLIFTLDDNICRAEFTPADYHCGFDGITHGGIIFSALDDVMANWIVLQGMQAFTAKVDLRYKASLPTGTKVTLEGRCLKARGRLMQMQGRMLRADNGQVVAECEASFMKANISMT